MKSYYFKSERLGFRNWLDSDLPIFIEMCADVEVMKYFTRTRTAKEAEGMVKHIQKHMTESSTFWYAVDRLDTDSFIGFIGFWEVTYEADFTPCIEIGWRLRKEAWNKGFATEGALACLQYGFQTLQLDEVISMTTIPNKPSENVMKKIGMRKVGEFDHPKIEAGHRLRKHVLYKIEKSEWEKSNH